MSHFRKFMQEDRVVYVGSRIRGIGSKPGWVYSDILNAPGEYVVEFGDDSFVVHENEIEHFRGSFKSDDPNNIGGIEIRRNRRRASEDEQ